MKNNTKRVVLLIPQPIKYDIEYTRVKDNVTKQYKISQPIEVTDTALTAYCFGRGVRTFNIDGIVSIKQAV